MWQPLQYFKESESNCSILVVGWVEKDHLGEVPPPTHIAMWVCTNTDVYYKLDHDSKFVILQVAYNIHYSFKLVSQEC